VNGNLLFIKKITMRKNILILLLLLPLKGVFAQLHIPSGMVFTISAGSTQFVDDIFIEPGGILINLGSLHVSGNVEFDGIITSMNDLVFDGTSSQLYKGLPLTVGTLTINNAAGVTIEAPVTVGTATIFTAGLLTTSTASPLIYASGAATGVPTDISHVNGPVRYNGTTAFTFPVGDALHYRPVGVKLASNTSGITASYFSEAAPAGTLTGLLQSVSKFEYWTLTARGTASGMVTLNWDANKVSAGIANATGVAAVRVAHLSGGSWINEGGAGTGTPSAGLVTSGTVSIWGSFTLGSTDRANASLPLTFLGIDATLLPDGSRKVNWQVAAEVQLKDYSIERSPDGRQFADIGTVKATGASAYTYTDAQAAAGKKLYYRVRGNDLDGKTTHSRIVAVQPKDAGSISIMPNPVKDHLTVSFGARMDGRYVLDLLSADGRQVYHTGLRVSGIQTFTISRPANMAKGMYVARIRDENGNVQTFKLAFE
jgi:hypothetical protein